MNEVAVLAMQGKRGARVPYRVAVEDIEPDHYVCWVLDLPGCFSSERDLSGAVAGAPGAIADYYTWIERQDPSLPVVTGPFQVAVVEEFRAHPSPEDPDYLVNAFFDDDSRPLSYWEVAAALWLLDWSRQDLLKVVATLSPEELRQPVHGEDRGTIAGVLGHVAGAENWYCDQLDRSVARSSLPEGVLERLEAVRMNSRCQLIALIGDARVAEYLGERWSARKVLRRMVWHERDHTQHIAQLIGRLTG